MAGTDAELRAASAGDVEAVVALVQSAYRGPSSRAGWTTEADHLDGGRTDAAEVTSMIDDPDGAVLVLDAVPCPEDRGGPAGLLACCHVHLWRAAPAPTASFGLFAVDPVRQGAGTGRFVLDAAAAYSARRWGATRQRIGVLAPRADLIAWYERRGFVATGEREPFPSGDERYGRPRRTGLDFIVLERPIGPAGV